MNERIKELAEAAYRDVACNDTIGDTVSREAVDRKFAELIIKECVEIIQYGMDHTEYDDSVEYEAQKWSRDAIKEHFGVEE